MRCSTVLILAAAWACSPETGSTTATVRDSVGVRIVENPIHALALDWFLESEPAVQIGGTDVGELYELYAVRSAARLLDGRIVIANGGTQELRFYSPDGGYLNSAGGEGEGPGEFRRMGWMQRLAGDSLFVHDYGLRRISVFSGGGEFVRSIRLESTPDLPFASPIGVYADLTMLARGFANSGDTEPDGLQRYESPMYHLDSDGLLMTELGLFSGDETYYQAFEGGFRFYDAVFPRSTRFIVRDDVFYVAANDHCEIRLFSPAGELKRIVRRDHIAVVVTDEHLRLERDRRDAASGPTSSFVRLGVFDEIPKPEFFPAYLHLRVDDARNMWVQEFPVPGTTSAVWSVFDSTGVLLGEVEAPLRFEPYHIGDDFLLGMWRDELDVEYVRLYELNKR